MQTLSPPAPLPLERARHDNADADAARADLAACREQLRNGSRTFLAASLLLPRRVREPACALYAFCRAADDAVDEQGARSDAVARLRDRLARVYQGRPMPLAADRALAHVVARFDIPRLIPEALLDGFEWDAQGRRYETLDELHAYAARVAGTVGAMMALLMGVRSAAGLARACDLGVAMQLSNIARDVGEDARLGRIYLPRQWLREVGIDPEAWLARPVFNAALAAVVQRLLREADALYARVDAGVAELPLSCRAGINAARFLYADIGHEVARRGLDSVNQRAVVAPSRKARLLARALLHISAGPAGPAAPPLAATRFLVDAVVGSMRVLTTAAPHALHAASRTPQEPPWWDIPGRAVWVLDLFERLSEREQARRSAPLS